MTDCCLCVCFRPRTYKRLIKDVFQSNYQYRNELTLQHFSKGKYERLIQYMVNYPSKLSLILMKLESKFVKFYLRREISQLLLVIEIMKGVIQDYSKRSLQHLLETHLLFFINESLQTKEIVLLQAITLLLKECIKHQVFYNYNTFVGLATTSQSLQQGRGGHFNEDERITTQKKSKKELISLPYTKDEHYDFILYILYLCNNIIHQQKLQKLKELNEKEIELQSSLKTKKPLNSDTDDYNRVEKEEEEKISEEEEGREDRSNDDFHDFSTVTSNFPLNDETDALTCLGLTMIITIFGLFRSQGNNVTSSSSTPSPTTNLYLNHIHNTNNKYFYIILQTIIKLLIFITPTIDKQSIYTAFPKLTNNEMMNKIFQETRKLLQQQPRQQHQGNSNGSTNNTSDSAAFDTLESPEANNNITVTVSFLIWKIIKLYFHYQTIHESSLLYDQMIFTICNTFYQCSIPFNSSLFLRLQCFIYKSYQSSYYHSNHQQHHQTFKGMSGNTVPPILFFRIESLLCKFLINTIYTKNHHSSDSFILKRNYLEQKNAIEKSYKKKNKSSGEGGNVIDDPLIRIQLLQLQYKYYYQQYETIPTIVQLTTELNDFQSFLFDGSELFQRQIQQHFHFLQDSLSFLFLYLNYFLKVSPYQEKSQSHATTTTTDINATSSSSSAAPIATTATSRNHIDSLIQFNYFIQIILSYLMKTNDNYFYSKDLLKKNNEFFTTNTNSNHTATPEGGSKDAAIGGKKEKNDEDNVFLSSIRRSFHYRNGDQGSAGALAEGGGSTGAPVSSKGFLSSYNKYLSTSNRTTSQDSVHDDEITRIIDEEGLLRSSRSADSATGQRKPFQQKNKKKYELILDEDEDDDKNDPNEGSEVVNISRSLDLTTFTTEPSIKTEDNNKDIKKEKTEKQLKHEEILDNIIFLIYEIMKTFTQHSLYQFQLNANITMVLDIVLQKTVSIEKALFLHQITPSMPVVDGGMMLNPIVGRGRAGSSNALKRTVSSAGLSLMSHSKDYRKHYQLQYFYYYSFSLLELILSNISINYSSIIIFSLEEAARNSRLHDPSSEITTPTTSSLLMTPTMMMSLESLLKSFEEMECFQQILLFIMKVMTLFSVLMMNNHFPDAIVQQIILHQESIPYNASTLTSSSSFKSSSLLTREQRAIYQKQILKFINEMTSSITVHEQMAEHRGLNSMPATAYFTLTDGAVNEVKEGNKGVISEKLYEFLFQRLLFYPYSINEFHSFLSIIFNHLMNLSSDYYIPKLVFYWNFHIYLTLLIGENCLITTITMFHKILSLLPILENNLIQKNFLYYYIIQYFIFISQLIYDDSLSSFLKQSYLSQLSYMNIIKENIGIEPLLSSSSAASSRKQEGLSLMILLKYTRTFYYNAHRVPVPPKVRNVMQGEGEGSEKKKGLSTISKGIYALQSTYVINQSIYVKDIHINLSEIVTKLMNNEILKQYSFELTEALSSNFVPFDPSSNIFLHLKKIKEKEEEKEKAQLAELRELEKEKRKEEEKVNSVPTVRKLFPLEDNTEAKEDDNEQSDAQSVSSHNSHGSNSSHASSSSQRKAKKSRKKSKKGSIERDSTHLIREALETDQENKVDINSGIESDLNQEDLTTKRVMKKRRPTMDVMKRKTGKNKRRGSNNTDDSEIGEGDEEEVERGTIATVEERSEASGKSHKSKKSIKSSRSKQSHRSNRSTRSVKSSLTTISQKKEFKDIYDLIYNDTKHEDELKSVITGATSALPSRHNHGVESIQEESHSSHRAASDRGLDKNHRTVNWRHFYHQKSREYHSQIVQSKDHDQLINVLESL